jgi:hypothetical protein
VKAVLLSLFAGLSVACAETIPEWQTPSGTVYRNAIVVAVHPDGISLQYEEGVVKIDYDNLTVEQQETYHLTAAGRDVYLARQRENERLEREAAERRKTEEANAPRKITANYVTVEDIKRLWISRVTMPSPLEKNYKSMVSEREEYLRGIRNGSRDRDAEKAAAGLNKTEAVRVGDLARAELEESTLARIAQAEADDASRAQMADYQRKQLEALRAASEPTVSDPVVVSEPDPGYSPPVSSGSGTTPPSYPSHPVGPPCPPSPPSPSQPPPPISLPVPVGR